VKLFKKAKDLFKKMTGGNNAPPPPPAAPAADPMALFEILPPLPKYQQEQRDFEARAKDCGVVWNSSSKALGGNGTRVAGRNAAKRSKRAALEPKYGRRWKKYGVGAMPLAVSA
jgi:hypothetical protein